MHQLPQHVVGGDLQFLDDPGIVGRSGQHVGGGAVASNGPAVAAGQGHGQQPALACGGQPGPDAVVVAVGRDAECDVLGGGQVAQLVGEDAGHAVPLGHPGGGGDGGGG